MPFKLYLKLMRLDKPIGILLLLWPTLWALWLANHSTPSGTILLVFTLGTIVMRSAGCVINDIADRHYDGAVERTQTRVLVTQEVSLIEAVLLFTILLLIAVSLLFFLEVNLFMVAATGAAIAILYPFCKRFLVTPQIILGFAFSWGIPLAFLSLKKPLTAQVWLLMLINFLWIICYDTYYALVDMQDDLKIGIHSTAIFLGDRVLWVIGGMQLLIACLWLLLAYLSGLSTSFYILWMIAHSLFFYQNRLAVTGTREGCFTAFLNNHWYGLLMFAAIVMAYASF